MPREMQNGYLTRWGGREVPEDEMGKFGLGIRVFRREDGTLEYQTQSVNQRVPVEIVIMQLIVNQIKNRVLYFGSLYVTNLCNIKILSWSAIRHLSIKWKKITSMISSVGQNNLFKI